VAVIRKRARFVAAAALVILVVAFASYTQRNRIVPIAGMVINFVRSFDAPAGTLTIESNQPSESREAPESTPNSQKALGPDSRGLPEATSSEWRSYNGTLASNRYSSLNQIHRGNIGALEVLCTYDTKQYSSFQTGPLVVDGMLIGTTERDIFAIDPATCAERWRTHDADKSPAVNRGAAYLDGLLYRGTGDGRVIAYDARSGAQVWATTIAEPRAGESVPAAPIAWNGLVFVGNAGGDRKGAKGRMYALDAKTGKIVWEFYLVPRSAGDVPRGPQSPSPLDASTWGNGIGTPISGGANWTSYTLDTSRGELYVPSGNSAPDFVRELHPGKNLYSGSVVVLDAATGAYKRHFELTPGDWHDWDVSNAPALIATQTGRRLMAVAPKDGRLYGFDLDTSTLVFRTPVDRIENADTPFSTQSAVHFCPGGRGGAEWNSPAYDPETNLIFVGEIDWCSTVKIQSNDRIAATKLGKVWAGMASPNPYDTFGAQDSYQHWAGWVYAVDADSGAWKWRAKSNFPIQGAITPTGGGIVFFGDMGGNFYALDTRTGHQLWSTNLGGAVGGGVITYTTGGSQRVAVAIGFTSVLWPTKVVTGKIVLLGLRQP
jgi:alcohol dehydrogenase (cytochrome c)